MRRLQRASPSPAIVVPKSRSVAGSGVGLKGGEKAAKPDVWTENSKECDPGVSPKRKVLEPESKLLQLLTTTGKQRVLLSTNRKVKSSVA